MSDQASCQHRRAVDREPLRQLQSAMYPGRASFGGRTVLLQPLNPSQDGEELFAISHNSQAARSVWEYMSCGPFDNVDSMEAWLRENSASADPLFYVIHDRIGGVVAEKAERAGMASLLNIHPLDGIAEIGNIWFAPAFQRTLQATEALYLLMRHVLCDLAYRRLEWKCNAENQTSRQAALRLGFRYEGLFYNHMIAKGRNRDTAWYSILDSEWSPLRANFERWLAAGNFDRNGRQRSSLGEMNRALWSPRR